MLFLSTPALPAGENFETTNIANKTNVVFNTPPQVAGVAGPGLSGLVDIPMASTGLTTLTINTPNAGDNNVAFGELPAAVTTSYFGGGDEELASVTGEGVTAGTILELDGGPATTVLDYNAGGLNPTVTAGALPGEVLIALPGFGSIAAQSFQQISISTTSRRSRLPRAPPGPSRTSRASSSSTPPSPRSACRCRPSCRPLRASLPACLPVTSPRQSTGVTPRPIPQPAPSRRTRAIRACTTSPARTSSPSRGATQSVRRSPAAAARSRHRSTVTRCRSASAPSATAASGARGQRRP